jgi:hypothetical protein
VISPKVARFSVAGHGRHLPTWSCELVNRRL